MVYETQPENAETTEDKAEVRPLVQSTTDEWLARISDQLQFFVDAAKEYSETDDEDDSESDGDPSTVTVTEPATGTPQAADSTGATSPDKSAAAKTTAAKRAEVKGN